MSKRIQIRVSDEDFAHWTAQAAELRLSLSGYIRARVITANKIAQRAQEAKPEPLPVKPFILCATCKRDGRAIGCNGCARLN